MGPGYVHMHVETTIGPMIIVQTVTPVEPLLQRVIHRMYCPPLLMPYAGFTLIGEAIQVSYTNRPIGCRCHKLKLYLYSFID